jgi:uncharacterized protein YjiS (DUF1127 family)
MEASFHSPEHRRASNAPDGWRRAFGVWQGWRQRLRTRAELRSMDARSMADIGLDAETARQEACKFFWQA